MALQNIFYVKSSQVLGGPGIFLIQVPGVTVTLPNWLGWADANQSVTIKDMTGSQTPNITILGGVAPGGIIDTVASMEITVPNESLTFTPWINGNSWVVS